MNLSEACRDLKSATTGATLAFLGAIGLGVVAVVIGNIGRTKITLDAVAGVLVLVGVYLARNPRLCCLWGLMLTLTLDVTKRFGPFLMKLGGETAFKIELSDFFWLGLLFFLLRDCWHGYRAGLRIPKVTLIWMALIAMGCGWILFGDWSLAAGHEVVRMLKGLVLFIVITNELERPGTFLHCAAGFMCAIIGQSAIGLGQYFSGHLFGLTALGESDPGTIKDLMENSVRTERLFRVGALMAHPNSFGILLAVVLPMAVGLFLVRTNVFYKSLAFLAIIMGLPSLIVTFSRSSWASFAASFSLMMLLVFFHKGLRWRALLPAAAATLGLAIVCVFYSGQIMSRLFESYESSTYNRSQFEDEAKILIGEKPILGWGLNSYALAVVPFTKYSTWGAATFFGSWVPVVHHTYYLWWAETGLLGLSLQLLLLACIIWTSIRNLRVRNDVLFILNAACLCGMTAFVVDGFNDPALRNNLMLRVFWVQSGMIMAVRYWRMRFENVSQRQAEFADATRASGFWIPEASLGGAIATSLSGTPDIISPPRV